jgi:hypothetical protein
MPATRQPLSVAIIALNSASRLEDGLENARFIKFRLRQKYDVKYAKMNECHKYDAALR